MKAWEILGQKLFYRFPMPNALEITPLEVGRRCKVKWDNLMRSLIVG